MGDKKNIIDELAEQLDAKGLKITFGLEAQGHIPTIERIIKEMSGEVVLDGKSTYVDMTYDKYTWEKIGKEIGWCSFTAALYYFRYLDEQKNK